MDPLLEIQPSLWGSIYQPKRFVWVEKIVLPIGEAWVRLLKETLDDRIILYVQYLSLFLSTLGIGGMLVGRHCDWVMIEGEEEEGPNTEN
jgi:hypothetical protein